MFWLLIGYLRSANKGGPEVGIAPTSPRLQRGANLPQLLGGWLAEPKLSERRLVVPAGNAPASSGYQPGALLLSYETVHCGRPRAEGVGNAPTSGLSRSCFRDRRSQLISACLPNEVSNWRWCQDCTTQPEGSLAFETGQRNHPNGSRLPAHLVHLAPDIH